MVNLWQAIDSAHAEMRRLYCLNPGGRSRAFVLEREAALIAGRRRLAALYGAMGSHLY
jgi:hypothetical protein